MTIDNIIIFTTLLLITGFILKVAIAHIDKQHKHSHR